MLGAVQAHVCSASASGRSFVVLSTPGIVGIATALVSPRRAADAGDCVCAKTLLALDPDCSKVLFVFDLDCAKVLYALDSDCAKTL